MWHAWESKGMCKRFWWESQKERDHSKVQGVDGRKVSEWILRKVAGGVNWISLHHNGDWWRAVVYVVMNLRVLALRSKLFDENCGVSSRRDVFETDS
jgi:hypothetical protein